MRAKESCDFHPILYSFYKWIYFQMRAKESFDFHPIHQSSTHFIKGYISIRDPKKALTFIQSTNPPLIL